MLATADCTNHYMEQIVYESSWSDNTSNGISWFNLLTTEPIPEETDITDISHTPVRNNSGRSCSTSSIESCYVVLEIQRPRSDTEISTNIEKQQEDDEEEEEMEEEMEELHFAQVKINEHSMDSEQLTVSLTLEVNFFHLANIKRTTYILFFSYQVSTGRTSCRTHSRTDLRSRRIC